MNQIRNYYSVFWMLHRPMIFRPGWRAFLLCHWQPNIDEVRVRFFLRDSEDAPLLGNSLIWHVSFEQYHKGKWWAVSRFHLIIYNWIPIDQFVKIVNLKTWKFIPIRRRHSNNKIQNYFLDNKIKLIKIIFTFLSY